MSNVVKKIDTGEPKNKSYLTLTILKSRPKSLGWCLKSLLPIEKREHLGSMVLASPRITLSEISVFYNI
jgi:hypothetical protein